MTIFWKKLILYLGVGVFFGSRGIIWINLVDGPQGDAPYQRPCGSRQEFFFMISYLAYVNHVAPGGWAIFGPRGIFWTNVVEIHEVMLHTKYQGYRPCGFRQEELFMFSLYNSMLNIWPLGAAHFWPQGYNLNKLGRGPLDDATHQISRL